MIVKATTRATAELIERTARTILRIKGRVVKVSQTIALDAPETRLQLVPSLVQGEGVFDSASAIEICGSRATRLFESMVDAQAAFQSNAKTDPPFICPVTLQPCLTEQDEFCEDYGCARKIGIDVDRDLIG